MAGPPGWAPEQVDPTRPSIARVYDYYLGGLWRPDNAEDVPTAVHEYPGFAGVGRRP